MRVKIGDTWYSSEEQPLGVQFTESELACVKQLEPDSSSMSFVSGRSGADEELIEWLREGR